MSWLGAQNAQCTCQKWRGLYTHCFPGDVYINHHNLLLFFPPAKKSKYWVWTEGYLKLFVGALIDRTAGHLSGLSCDLWNGLGSLTSTLMHFATFFGWKRRRIQLDRAKLPGKAIECLWQSLLHGEAALLAADLNGYVSSQFHLYMFGVGGVLRFKRTSYLVKFLPTNQNYIPVFPAIAIWATT